MSLPDHIPSYKRAIFQRFFLGIMFAFMAPMTWKMGTALWKADRSWDYVETQCRILKNEWRRTADGPRLDLEYEYVFQNTHYKQSRYQWGLDHFSNQSRQSASKFVKANPPGSTSVCYFNSAQPDHAVVHPQLAEEYFKPADPS